MQAVSRALCSRSLKVGQNDAMLHAFVLQKRARRLQVVANQVEALLTTEFIRHEDDVKPVTRCKYACVTSLLLLTLHAEDTATVCSLSNDSGVQ